MKAITMPRQSDWMLPLAAIMVLILGAVAFQFEQRLPPVVWEGRDLVAGLDPSKLTKIALKQGGHGFTLVRQGDGFMIDSLGMAPADYERVNEILLRLGGAQIGQVIGDKEDWEKYQVKDDNAELTVELFNQASAANWKIYFGKTLPGTSGRAVRLAGKDEVFSTKDHIYLASNPDEYLKKTAFILDKAKIQNLELYQNGQRVEEGKFVKDDILSALAPLRVSRHIRTGNFEAGVSDLNWTHKAHLLHESGIAYKVEWAKKDEKWFARAQAELALSSSENMPVIDLKQLMVKSEADRFNQQNMPWVWELDSESVEFLTKGFGNGEEKHKEQNKVSKNKIK